MKPKLAKPKLPPPVEWDFRRVTESELALVIAWEYARESDTIKRSITRWHNQAVGGVTVKTILADFGDDSPEETQDFVLEGMPKVSQPLYGALLAGAEFPLPWLSIDPMRRGIILEELEHRSRPPLAVYPMASPHAQLMVKRMPSMGYWLSVDFDSATVDGVVRAFERWARTEFKKHPRTKRGKASSQPWHQLKALAALRLSKADLNFEDAQDAIGDYQVKVEFDPTTDARLLPLFSDSPGWHKAIASAKAQVKAS